MGASFSQRREQNLIVLKCCFILLYCLSAYNFSHRIDHLSFGELIPGIINPLDGTEKIASDRKCCVFKKASCFLYFSNSTFKILPCFINVVICQQHVLLNLVARNALFSCLHGILNGQFLFNNSITPLCCLAEVDLQFLKRFVLC